MVARGAPHPDRVSASDDISTAVRTMLAHHMLEAASEAVLVLNTDDRIIFASRAATHFGWSLPALIGRDWNDLVHPDDDGRPRLLVDSVVDSAFSGLDREVRLRDPYGMYHRVRMKAYTSWTSHAGAVTVVVAQRLDRD